MDYHSAYDESKKQKLIQTKLIHSSHPNVITINN